MDWCDHQMSTSDDAMSRKVYELPEIDSLVEKLKTLRRGRGLLADDLPTRIGVTLRKLASISDGDSPIVGREKLVDFLDVF